MDEQLEPFDWWFSGRFWYCSLQAPDVKRVSGCGSTKPQAVADARKELQKRRHKSAVSASAVQEKP
jgi:hypothetical protein